MNLWILRPPRGRWKLWIGGVALGFTAIACVLALSQQRDFRGDCVPPRAVDSLGPRIYDNHQAVTVSRGRIVTAQLITSASEVWPWGTPHSSDEAVLKPIPLCFDPTNVSSLPVQLTPFKAVAPGKAVITADALSGDTGQTFTITVTVTP
jgi:hypothetical protein